jgi:hypothetical protein
MLLDEGLRGLAVGHGGGLGQGLLELEQGLGAGVVGGGWMGQDCFLLHLK